MRWSCDECPRCGDDHADVTMEALANPPDWAGWWWTCPVTDQPVFTHLFDGERQTFAEACGESLTGHLDEAERALSGAAMTPVFGVNASDVELDIIATIKDGLQAAKTGAQDLLVIARDVNRRSAG